MAKQTFITLEVQSPYRKYEIFTPESEEESNKIAAAVADGRLANVVEVFDANKHAAYVQNWDKALRPKNDQKQEQAPAA